MLAGLKVYEDGSDITRMLAGLEDYGDGSDITRMLAGLKDYGDGSDITRMLTGLEDYGYGRNARLRGNNRKIQETRRTRIPTRCQGTVGPQQDGNT